MNTRALGLLLSLVVALLSGTKLVATCDLPGWGSWEKVDLTTDVKAQELATAALKEYVEGLQQAASDLECIWEAVTTDVKAACAEPGSQRYAMQFAYSVPCKAGEERDNMEDLVLSGVIEGVLPAGKGGVAGLDVEAYSNTRNLLMEGAH